MSAERLPWMPMYTDDFLGITGTWGGQERGLYALLLILEWGSGPLPDDPARLAQITHHDLATFSAAWKTVASQFESTAAGLVNQELEVRRAAAHELRAAHSEAGKAGAAKRWPSGKRNGPANSQANGAANTRANGKTVASPMASTSTSITTSIDSNTNISKREGEAKIAPSPLSKREIDERWSDLRKAYPKRHTKAQHTNVEWGEARTHARKLIQDNRATWESLFVSAEDYAKHCDQTQHEPMSAVDFFGSSEGHWLTEWLAVAPVTEIVQQPGLR